MVATELRHRVARTVDDAKASIKTAVKTELTDMIVKAAPDKLEPLAAKAAVACGVAGIVGSLLMLLGDVLLYGPTAWGKPASVYFEEVDPVGGAPEKLAASLMSSASRQRTIVGGALGPLAAFFYLFGSMQMLLAAIPIVQIDGKLEWSSEKGGRRLLCGRQAMAAYQSAARWSALTLCRRLRRPQVEEDTVEDERVVLIVDVGTQAISAALLVVASRVLRDYM